MREGKDRIGSWMVIVVVAHLLISLVHGAAHTLAQVLLSPAANAFVFAVILAGPLIGLGLMWPFQRAAAWLIALTMAGALVFGLVNHFVFSSPDHVAHVDPQWRPLFATTAVLLALTEALATGLAIQSLLRRKSL